MCEIMHAANKDAKYGSSLLTAIFVMSFAVLSQDDFKASKLLKKPFVAFT